MGSTDRIKHHGNNRTELTGPQGSLQSQQEPVTLRGGNYGDEPLMEDYWP